MPAKKNSSSSNKNPFDKRQNKTIKDKKSQALNLFEKSEKNKSDSKIRVDSNVSSRGSIYSHLSDNKLTKTSTDKEETNLDEDDLSSENERVIHIKPPIIVKELAERMNLKPFKIVQDLMEMDVFANHLQSIEPSIAVKLCEKHGFIFEREKRKKGAGIHKTEEIIEAPKKSDVKKEKESDLSIKPPVVTFMGHVDHGKTSLLDAYRGSKITKGEIGGITQHIGAYKIECNKKAVTFIDTPGHAAFSQMRSRGADITDIVVLIVAANDGLMPTTYEAIDHCKAAKKTIIVAINKIDLPGADINKVKSQLQEINLTPEDWGGDTICVEISVKEKKGLDDLIEMIHLQAELLELKTNIKDNVRGTVIESKTIVGKGITATVLIQSGTLKRGNSFICGNVYGKVKAILNDVGKPIDEATPATPVEILGFSSIPNIGDEFIQMESEQKAKKLSLERLEESRKKELKSSNKSALETLFSNIKQSKIQTLKIIIKADAQGSLQAIEKSLLEIKSEKISLDIIRKGIGPITEADVLLASASNAVLIGFNTKVESKSQPIIKREGIQVKLFSIIYELIDQIKESMLGLLEIETREKIVGHAKILEVFKLSSGKVSGCVVIDGRILRNARARVLRDRIPIYDGGFSTLRRFKDDVKEVKNGLECGIKLGNFNDYEKEDIIECYELEKLEASL